MGGRGGGSRSGPNGHGVRAGCVSLDVGGIDGTEGRREEGGGGGRRLSVRVWMFRAPTGDAACVRLLTFGLIPLPLNSSSSSGINSAGVFLLGRSISWWKSKTMGMLNS